MEICPEHTKLFAGSWMVDTFPSSTSSLLFFLLVSQWVPFSLPKSRKPQQSTGGFRKFIHLLIYIMVRGADSDFYEVACASKVVLWQMARKDNECQPIQGNRPLALRSHVTNASFKQ